MALTRDELILLANKIRNAEGKTEKENDAFLTHFLDNVMDPNASNYFFEPAYDQLSPEEIVDRILAYKPIQL
jgi:hypothetical protein